MKIFKLIHYITLPHVHYLKKTL